MPYLADMFYPSWIVRVVSTHHPYHLNLLFLQYITVAEALTRLDERHRAALTLRYLQDKPAEQVAHLLRVQVRQVFNIVNQGLDDLAAIVNGP